jgi:hypothetical protein
LSMTDQPITWHWNDDGNLGWHTCHLPNHFDQVSTYMDRYDEIVNWITESIEKYERHARWKIDYETIYVKFRYERDYVRFVLRWS